MDTEKNVITVFSWLQRYNCKICPNNLKVPSNSKKNVVHAKEMQNVVHVVQKNVWY